MFAIAPVPGSGHPEVAMDPRPSRAESLPSLYRAILDAVGELEARGDRTEAVRARRAATAAYAIWDDAAERHLNRILADLRRAAAPPSGRTLFRRRSRPGPDVATAASRRADGAVESASSS